MPLAMASFGDMSFNGFPFETDDARVRRVQAGITRATSVRRCADQTGKANDFAASRTLEADIFEARRQRG